MVVFVSCVSGLDPVRSLMTYTDHFLIRFICVHPWQNSSPMRLLAVDDVEVDADDAP